MFEKLKFTIPVNNTSQRLRTLFFENGRGIFLKNTTSFTFAKIEIHNACEL